MNRIDQAKENGCFHCLKSTSFTETTIDKKRALVCNECGCRHYEDGYSFGIPAKYFEAPEVFQNSAQENDRMVANYRKQNIVTEELAIED